MRIATVECADETFDEGFALVSLNNRLGPIADSLELKTRRVKVEEWMKFRDESGKPHANATVWIRSPRSPVGCVIETLSPVGRRCGVCRSKKTGCFPASADSIVSSSRFVQRLSALATRLQNGALPEKSSTPLGRRKAHLLKGVLQHWRRTKRD